MSRSNWNSSKHPCMSPITTTSSKRLKKKLSTERWQTRGVAVKFGFHLLNIHCTMADLRTVSEEYRATADKLLKIDISIPVGWVCVCVCCWVFGCATVKWRWRRRRRRRNGCTNGKTIEQSIEYANICFLGKLKREKDETKKKKGSKRRKSKENKNKNIRTNRRYGGREGGRKEGRESQQRQIELG